MVQTAAVHSSSSMAVASKPLLSEMIPAANLKKLDLRSRAFQDGRAIPERYSGEGEDISPPLEWQRGTSDVKEYLLICEDPDAPRDEPYVHWVLSNIPASTHTLKERIGRVLSPQSPYGSRQSNNSSGSLGYTGPMPPSGHGLHRYYFQLFALSDSISLARDISRAEILEAIEDKVLGIGKLMGTYERTELTLAG